MTPRREYGTGSIYRRKSDGRWLGTIEAGYTATGARRRITLTGKTEAEVKRKIRDKRLELERGGAHTGRRVTVKAWSETWLQITERTLRPKTWSTNRGQIRNWIVPAIGAKHLADLTPADLRTVATRQRAAKQASSSILRTQNVLMKLLKDAVAEGHTVPPAVLAVKPGRNQQKIREQATGRRQALAMEQVAKIFDVLADRPDRSRYVIPFLQGLRQGETLGLTWDAVDLEAGSLTIEWQLQGLPYIDRRDKAAGFRVPDDYQVRHLEGAFHLVEVKTGAGVRTIPLIPEAVDVLREWRTTAAPVSRHGLVWARPDGRPIDKGDDLDAWKQLQDAAGVRHPAGRHYYLHEIRNVTATLLIELGVDPLYITAIMGHTDIAMSRHYATVNQAQMRAALEQVGARLQLGR